MLLNPSVYNNSTFLNNRQSRKDLNFKMYEDERAAKHTNGSIKWWNTVTIFQTIFKAAFLHATRECVLSIKII